MHIIVIFNWRNLTNKKMHFAFILLSGVVSGQVVGVERFADGEQLSLQLQVGCILAKLLLILMCVHIALAT